jgi:hypothetical protein
MSTVLLQPTSPGGLLGASAPVPLVWFQPTRCEALTAALKFSLAKLYGTHYTCTTQAEGARELARIEAEQEANENALARAELRKEVVRCARCIGSLSLLSILCTLRTVARLRVT